MAARAGQIDLARQLLAQVLQADPHNETAWLWMSGVLESLDERIYCLRRVLEINPNHEMARKGLRALGVSDEPAPAAQAAQRQAPGGVPILEDELLARALWKADPIVNQALYAADSGALEVEWVRGLRAPRRALPSVSPATLTLLIGVMGAAALIFFGVAVYRLIRASHTAAVVIPTPTITFTPSIVPTSRPTRTPTATLGPGEPTLTPSPTYPVMAPRGVLSMGLTPTQPYIGTPHPANRAIDDAIDLFREGDYEGAIAAIRAARESGPDAADSYYYEGMALLELKEPGEAQDVFEAGLAVDPTFAPLHVGLSRAYLSQGAINRARSAAERARELDPELIEAYLALAEVARSDGDIDAALAAIDEALVVAPYNVEVLVAQGQTLLAGGQPDRAAAVGNLAVYIDPTAESANALLAEARMALGQYTQAAVLLEGYLMQINPSSAEAWTMLGRAYLGEGNPPGARDAYNWALALVPDNPSALTALGELSLASGDAAGAYDYFDRALAIREDPDARYGRATSALALGDTQQALADIAPLYTQQPEDPQVALLYARVLLETEDYEEAAAVADSALALPLSAEEQGEAHEVRGRARYYMGDEANALTDLVAAMAIAETGTRHYYRALIREASGDVRGALLELDWVLFWSEIYDYPFTSDAAERRADLADRLEEIRTMTPTPWPTWTPSPPTEEPTPAEGGETPTP
jgi:tetratricopeptide (TPR) repeat protein